MQTETQRNFKEQMRQLEKSGKIEKKRPKYTVRFSEHKTITGIISTLITLYALSTWIIPGGLFNLPNQMNQKKVENYMEVANMVDLREETLVKQMVNRANLDTPFSTAEIDGLQGELDKMRESLLQVKDAETAVTIESKQLNQLQIILDNIKNLPLQTEQAEAINTAIESYNQLNQDSQNALIKYLTDNHINWHYNDDGSISYQL